MNILIIGNCGVGKTYAMKKFIEKYTCLQEKKVGLLRYNTNGWMNITGVYDGSTFEGSDKLSMSVMTSIQEYLNTEDGINIFEGDRFTNSTFIKAAKPTIIKILGSGKEGRLKRNSKQTQRHIDSIATRVNNINHTYEVDNSQTAVSIIETMIFNPSQNLNQYKPKQETLF
jgi:hypothetical protein